MLSGHHCRSLSSVTCDAAAASSPAHAMKIIRLRTLSFFAFRIGLVLSGRADQPEPTRVFVCAHSFMIFTSKLLPPIAKAAGFSYASAGQQMIGGSCMIQHWNLPEEKNAAKSALREGN